MYVCVVSVCVYVYVYVHILVQVYVSVSLSGPAPTLLSSLIPTALCTASSFALAVPDDLQFPNQGQYAGMYLPNTFVLILTTQFPHPVSQSSLIFLSS